MCYLSYTERSFMKHFKLFFCFLFLLPVIAGFSQEQNPQDSLLLVRASTTLYNDPGMSYDMVDSLLNSNKEIKQLTIAKGHGLMSKAKYLLGQYPKATDLAFLYLKEAREIQNKTYEADALNILGIIFQAQSDYDKAINYYLSSLAIREKLNNKTQVAASLANIGMIYQETKKTDTALKYLQKAKNILVTLDNKYELANTLNSISNIYWDAKQLDSAYNYQKAAIDIKTKIADSSSLGTSYINLGGILLDMKKVKEAEENYRRGILIAKKTGNRNILRLGYDYFSIFFEKMKRSDSAYHYLHLFKNLNDSLFNVEKSSQIAEMQMKFENEQKDKLRELEQKAKDAEQNAKLERQKLFTVASILILFLTIVFSAFLYRNYLNKKKAHQEIVEKNEIIERKSTEIIDSINYAKHLQDAILPPSKLIKDHFKESFIFYAPKDIVAGDFYWFEKTANLVFFAVADCTGHGVPGAMVSVVCSNALNRTVKEFGITEPGKILDRVKMLVVETFEKSENEVKDGMDISICSYDKENGQLRWAGANNPLWVVKKGEKQILELKPDKQPIGKSDVSATFTTHVITVNEGDNLYLFTDGLADQFGGPSGKKFKSSNLRELIISVQGKTMEEQMELIKRKFQEWKGNQEQVDDICMIGVKV
jgi:serine phosphatase RsbU (regulator of sigma subunit)